MMKRNILFALFLLASLTCLAKKKYTLTKEDFVKQFSAGIGQSQIYCFEENGRKVWFHFNKNTILTIALPNNGKKEVMLHSITYKKGIIEAIAYNVWLPTKKTYSVYIDSVHSFYLDKKYQFQEYVTSFFNTDSSRNLVRLKNDSLRSVYLSRDEWMMEWIPKSGVKTDTLWIRENACYHMVFKDSSSTQFGVVEKITPDSIYISSAFNPEWATANGAAYTVYRYALADIKQLRLLKPGGFSHKVIQAKDYELTTTKATKDSKYLPYWFAVNPISGEAEFYRSFMTFKGFAGIMEKEGKIYWFETAF